MTKGQQTTETGPALREVLGTAAAAVAEALRVPGGKPVGAIPVEVTPRDAAALGELLKGQGQSLGVRASLGDASAGRTLRLVLETRCLAALGRQQEDAALAELANQACTAIDGALRVVLGRDVGLRLVDHGLVDPSADAKRLLGEQPLAAMALAVQVAGRAEGTGLLLLDEASLAWLGVSPGRNSGVEELEAIPVAAIRGKASAFLVENDTVLEVRKSCRRVGLELDRRARTEIPNPAAHKDQVVIIELPTNEERRFDWCKRLKAYSDTIRVVLLLHHPTRQRVLQGFMAKADVLVGVPVQESLLSGKLAALLDGLHKSDEPDPAAKPVG